MKITIDTVNKTLEITSNISIEELKDFIREFNLSDYTIVPGYQFFPYYNGNYNGNYNPNINQPTITY